MHADNITIREAAERCGLNYGSWSNWERGKKPRDLLEIVEAISNGFGVDKTWLLFGGPLARAEDNRERWRPGTDRSDTDTGKYPAVTGRVARMVVTRPADTRPTNRPDASWPVAA